MTDLDLQRIRLYWDPVVHHMNRLKFNSMPSRYDFNLHSVVFGLTDYLKMAHLPKHKRKADELSLNYVGDRLLDIESALLDVEGSILDSTSVTFTLIHTALVDIGAYLLARKGAVEYDRLINNFDRRWVPDWAEVSDDIDA